MCQYNFVSVFYQYRAVHVVTGTGLQDKSSVFQVLMISQKHESFQKHGLKLVIVVCTKHFLALHLKKILLFSLNVSLKGLIFTTFQLLQTGRFLFLICLY